MCGGGEVKAGVKYVEEGAPKSTWKSQWQLPKGESVGLNYDLKGKGEFCRAENVGTSFQAEGAAQPETLHVQALWVLLHCVELQGQEKRTNGREVRKRD